jgi:pyruvate/2-oxoglutarate dehydrogenase complex dihydrolipoamide dehydrogenase (E3) component
MFDVVVIGGGPAGATAALRARELGATVALIERGRLGGICTNDGCVPTRVLARAARLVRDAAQFEDYGLEGPPPTVKFSRLLKRTQQIVDQVHAKKSLADHLAEAGVTVFEGAAAFVDAHSVVVDGSTVRAARFVICAGGRARRLPFPGNELALTHSDVWTLPSLPRSVAIVGSAATGCQLASVFASFGSRVTLFDVAPRVLPGEDELVSEVLSLALQRHGIEIHTGITGIERLETSGDSLRLWYSRDGEDQTLDINAVLLATGWAGNVETLNLEAAGVRHERGYIVVDDHLQTSVPHIYAAGDITGRMMLVQSATFEARIAAENAITGGTVAANHTVVPHGGFTDPEYGSVGLTEQQAREQHPCVVAVVPYADLDRAVIDGHADGLCKLVVQAETREILGAHVVGEHAVEVAQLVAAAMTSNARVEQLAQLELAYPTYTAIVGLAARQIVRELGVVPLAPAWRALLEPRAAEWEHSRR